VNESRTNESYLRILYVCPILGIADKSILTAFVASEELSLRIWILHLNHVQKAVWQLLAIVLPLYLKDIDAVPPIHAPVLLRRWKFVETVSQTIIIVNTSNCIFKYTISLPVRHVDRVLLSDALGKPVGCTAAVFLGILYLFFIRGVVDIQILSLDMKFPMRISSFVSKTSTVSSFSFTIDLIQATNCFSLTYSKTADLMSVVKI